MQAVAQQQQQAEQEAAAALELPDVPTHTPVPGQAASGEHAEPEARQLEEPLPAQ